MLPDAFGRLGIVIICKFINQISVDWSPAPAVNRMPIFLIDLKKNVVAFNSLKKVSGSFGLTYWVVLVTDPNLVISTQVVVHVFGD